MLISVYYRFSDLSIGFDSKNPGLCITGRGNLYGLVVLCVDLEVALGMLAGGADLGSLDTDDDVTAVAALPHLDFALLEDLCGFHVLQQGAVTLLVVLLPEGLPIAIARSPTAIVPEFPIVTAGNIPPDTFNTAKSSGAYQPTISASICLPAYVVTLTRSAPLTM